MKKTVKKSPIKKYQTGGVKPYAGGVNLFSGDVILAGSNKSVPRGSYAPSTVNTSNNRPVQNAPKVTIKPTATKPTAKKPAPKTSTTKSTSKSTTTKKPSYSAVADIKSRMYPNTGAPKSGTGAKKTTKPAAKPTTKPATKTTTKPATTKPSTTTKPAAKTVSQLWTEKTGLPWSEAKKQGMSDGSAASNMALMKKLQTGKPMEYISSGYKIPSEDEANAMDAAYDAAYGPAKTTMRKGGSVKKKMKSKKK